MKNQIIGIFLKIRKREILLRVDPYKGIRNLTKTKRNRVHWKLPIKRIISNFQKIVYRGEKAIWNITWTKKRITQIRILESLSYSGQKNNIIPR